MDQRLHRLQAHPLLDREDPRHDQIAGVGRDNGCTQHAVASRSDDQLDQPLADPVDHRPVDLGQRVMKNLDLALARLRLGLGQPDRGDFRRGEGDPRDQGVGLQPPEPPDQRVDRRDGPAVSGEMGELLAPGRVPDQPDVGHVLIGKGVEPEPVEPGLASGRDDQQVERHALFAKVKRAIVDLADLPLQQQSDAVGFERSGDNVRRLDFVALEHMVGVGDDGDLRSQPLQRLPQLAPDRPAAEHDHAPWRLRHGREAGPQRFAGDKAAGRHSRNVGDDRRGAGGDDDLGRADRDAAVDRDAPRIDHSGMADANIDAEAGEAFDAVVGRDRGDGLANAAHNGSKIDRRLSDIDTEARRLANLVNRPRGTDQRLRGNAAGVEAIAAHLRTLDQHHFGLQLRRDEARHQPARARADDDQIGVILARPGEAREDPAPLEPVRDPFAENRHQSEPEQRRDQPRRQGIAGPFDPRQRGPGEGVSDRPGQRAGPGDEGVTCDRHRRQPHRQIDEKEGKHRGKSERQQIDRPFLRKPLVDHRHGLGKFTAHPIARDKPRREHRQCRPDGRGDAGQRHAFDQPEQCPCRKSHGRSTGQRKRDNHDISGDESHRRGDRPLRDDAQQRLPLRLEPCNAQPFRAAIQQEQDHCERDQQQHDQLGGRLDTAHRVGAKILRLARANIVMTSTTAIR